MPPYDDGLDRARLDELRSLDGSGAMLTGVIATFESTCDALLLQLGDELAAGQDGPARESAHTLAGRALMIGAREAGEATRALEHALVAGEGNRARAQWSTVTDAFARARLGLSAYLAE